MILVNLGIWELNTFMMINDKYLRKLAPDFPDIPLALAFLSFTLLFIYEFFILRCVFIWARFLFGFIQKPAEQNTADGFLAVRRTLGSFFSLSEGPSARFPNDGT